MLARRLTIWFLVFVTSGLLWLAVPRNGHSEETCTTLNCVSRGKRKVEQQMRQQEMMRSGVRKSNMPSNGYSSEIRIRYLTGSNEHKRTSPLMDGSTKIDIQSITLMYDSWGITKSNYFFKGFWHENDGTKTPHEELDVSSYELNYTFGDTLTFTIGSIFHAEGTAKIYGWDGGVSTSTFEPKTKKPMFEESGSKFFGHRFPFISSLQLGYRFGFIEFVIAYNKNYIGFDDFECVDDKCVSPDSQKGLTWGTYNNETVMMGMGIIF